MRNFAETRTTFYQELWIHWNHLWLDFLWGILGGISAQDKSTFFSMPDGAGTPD